MSFVSNSVMEKLFPGGRILHLAQAKLVLLMFVVPALNYRYRNVPMIPIMWSPFAITTMMSELAAIHVSKSSITSK